MIRLTRLQGEEIVVNAGLIEFIEPTPDTVITMSTGRKVMVRESIDAVIEKVVDYSCRIGHPAVCYSRVEEEETQE
ncbi:MAG: flagellar FlbD family protein [Armatimonadota bacterium]